MPELTVDWTTLRQAWASQALLQVYPGGAEINGKAVYSKGLWADIIINMMLESTHLAWVAKAAGAIARKKEPITPAHPIMAEVLMSPAFLSKKTIGDPAYLVLADPPSEGSTNDLDLVWEQLNLRQAGLAMYAAQACCTKIYRTALRTRLPALTVFDQLPPGGEALRLPPLVIGAIVVVAIAAIAGGSWFGSEVSEDNAQVEIEIGMASAKTTLALDIAKTQIANGLPVSLPANLMNWGRRQKTLTDPWFKAAAAVAIVGAGGLGAFAGHKLGSA